jgi:hypothetical protein
MKVKYTQALAALHTPESGSETDIDVRMSYKLQQLLSWLDSIQTRKAGSIRETSKVLLSETSISQSRCLPLEVKTSELGDSLILAEDLNQIVRRQEAQIVGATQKLVESEKREKKALAMKELTYRKFEETLIALQESKKKVATLFSMGLHLPTVAVMAQKSNKQLQKSRSKGLERWHSHLRDPNLRRLYSIILQGAVDIFERLRTTAIDASLVKLAFTRWNHWSSSSFYFTTAININSTSY